MLSNALRASLNDYTYSLQDKSPITIDAYRKDVERFLQFVTERKVKRPEAIKRDLVVSYLGSRKDEGASPASVNRYYMAIRSYCKWLCVSEVLARDICIGVSAPRNKRKELQVPTHEQIDIIMKSPDCCTREGVRDRAILELLYSSGLRSSELYNLKLSDVTSTSVLIRCGKRDKPRCLPISTTAAYWINCYVEHHRKDHYCALMSKDILFLTLDGRKLTQMSLRNIVRKHARKAGIDNITTHTIRHTCATHLLEAGADLRFIQDMLGHVNIATTQFYTHQSSAALQEKFNLYSPRRA